MCIAAAAFAAVVVAAAALETRTGVVLDDAGASAPYPDCGVLDGKCHGGYLIDGS